jgi:hypothetical protein
VNGDLEDFHQHTIFSFLPSTRHLTAWNTLKAVPLVCLFANLMGRLHPRLLQSDSVSDYLNQNSKLGSQEFEDESDSLSIPLSIEMGADNTVDGTAEASPRRRASDPKVWDEVPVLYEAPVRSILIFTSFFVDSRCGCV